MKGGWDDLIGRRITEVMTLETRRAPKRRVVLILDDGTYFEIYSGEGDLAGTNRSHPGDLSVVLHHYRTDGECVVYKGGS